MGKSFAEFNRMVNVRHPAVPGTQKYLLCEHAGSTVPIVVVSGPASFAHRNALAGTFVPYSKSNDIKHLGLHSEGLSGPGALE